MKVIISTGHGRLHLIQSACAIKDAGIDVKVITGWVPSRLIPDSLLNFLGRIASSKNTAYGLRKRNPSELKANEIISCSFSEFFYHLLLILARLKLLDKDLATTWGWKLFGWQSKKYLREADIFHVRSGAGQGGAIKIAKQQGMKVVVDHSTAHPSLFYKQLLKANRDDPKSIEVYPSSKFWNLILEDCRQADIVQVSCDFVKKSFIENGFDGSQIFVRQLGIRPDFFSLKKNYSVGAVIKLLFSGTFSRGKGSALIIEAMAKLVKQPQEFQLDIIGTVTKDTILPDWFINHPRIFIHGHIPQDKLKSFFCDSDIYIFPTYCDGGAQALKEAMAAGLPVIATEQSGSPLVDGENGLVIPDDSAEFLTNAVIALSQNELLREKIGRNAAKTIREECTWEQYGEETSKLYDHLVKIE